MAEEFPIGTKVKWKEPEYQGPAYGDALIEETGVVIGYTEPTPIVKVNRGSKNGKEFVVAANKLTKMEGGGSRKKSLRRTRKNRNRFY